MKSMSKAGSSDLAWRVMVLVDMIIMVRRVAHHATVQVRKELRMIPYNSFKFFKPPRPEIKIPKGMLGHYGDGNWVAQAKLNGTYNIIGVAPDKSLHCLKRDGTAHRNWKPSEATRKAFERLPGDGWYVFCAELMNDKTPHIKNVNYIHDVIVANGQMLVGTKYIGRHLLLRDLLTSYHHNQHYRIVDDHTWIANLFFADAKPFITVYEDITTQPEIEGLVLKNINQELSLADMTLGMVKCRKPHKNYGF